MADLSLGHPRDDNLRPGERGRRRRDTLPRLPATHRKPPADAVAPATSDPCSPVALVVIVAFIALYFIGGAALPRWWSHRIGDQVDGSLSAGIGLGLFYGFVFTSPAA